MFISLFTTAAAVAQIGRVVAREAMDEVPVWAVTVGTSFTNYTPLVGGETTVLTIDQGWAWPELLRAALIGLLGLVVFEFHRRRWRVLLRRERGDG
jgi:hypothetical protein